MHNSATPKITGMTIAINNMSSMVNFYKHVFQANFEELAMFETTLYKTTIGGLEILFCPAELAQNTATQNRHQLNIEVENLETSLTLASNNGGEKVGEQQNDGKSLRIGIKDPDNNTLELIQKI